MNWLALEARIQKVQNDCTNPSSDLYRNGGSNQDRQLTFIDQAIQTIVGPGLARGDDWALSLQEGWNRFKAKVPHLIKVDRAVRAPHSEEGLHFKDELKELDIEENDLLTAENEALSQGIQALKETGVSQASIEQVERVAACHLSLLKIPIEQAKVATQASSTQSLSVAEPMGIEEVDPENLMASNAMQASMDTNALDQENRLNKEMGLLPVNRPHIAQAMRSLLAGLTAGRYGEKIVEAFRRLDPSVINQAALLKFLLMEHLENPLILHTLSELELEIPEGSKAAIEDLRTAMKTISHQEKILLVEKIFLRQGNLGFSEKEEKITDLLNNAVKEISLTRMDAQIFPRPIYHGLDAFDQYKQAFEDVANIQSSLGRVIFLLGTIERLRSAHPAQFFKAIDKALESIDQLEPLQTKEYLDKLATFLYEELEKDPHLAMTTLPEGSGIGLLLGDSRGRHMDEVGNIDEVRKRARLLTLWIPRLLSSDPKSAIGLIKKIEKYAKSHKDFTLPTALFQLLIKDEQNADPELALQVAKLVPLHDRAQCLIQLMNAFEGKVAPTKMNTWKRESLQQAQEFIKNRLCDYLEDRNADNAKQIKTNIRQLFAYLSSELGVDPKKLEFDLLTKCVESEQNIKTKQGLRILLIPELARIGEKIKAIGYAEPVVRYIREGNGDDSDKEYLWDSLLKAVGVKDEKLDRMAFGALSEPSHAELDPDLRKAFLDKMVRVFLLEEYIKSLIPLSRDIWELYTQQPTQSKKESYRDFSNEIAQEAIRLIDVAVGGSGRSLEGEISTKQTSVRLTKEFLEQLTWVNPKIVDEAKEHLQKMEDALFSFTKKKLDESPSMDPLARIKGYLELFSKSTRLKKRQGMVEIGNTIFNLMPSVNENDRADLWTNFREGALLNLEAVSQGEGEPEHIEKGMQKLVLTIVESVPTPSEEIRDLIRFCKRLSATRRDFPLQLGALAFKEIQKMGESPEGQSLDAIKLQQPQLARLAEIPGFRDLEIFPQVEATLEKLQRVLYERLSPLASFRDQISVYILLLNGCIVLNKFEEAVPIIKGMLENAGHQNLSRFREYIMTCIRGADRLGLSAIKTKLIDLFFQSLEHTQDPSARIDFLLNLPKELRKIESKTPGDYNNDPLYQEMSLIAVERALLAPSAPAEKMKRCLEFLYDPEKPLDQKAKAKEIFMEMLSPSTFNSAIEWIEDPLEPADTIKRGLLLLREGLVSSDQKTRIKEILDSRIDLVMDYEESQGLSEEIKRYFPDLKRVSTDEDSSSSNKKPKKP